MPHGSVRKATSPVHGHIFLCHPGHYFSLDNDLIDHHAKTIGIIGVGLYTALARYANRKTGMLAQHRAAGEPARLRTVDHQDLPYKSW